MKEPANPLARRIIARMAERDCTKTQLADRLRVSDTYIGKIVNIGQLPGADVTRRIADALDLEQDELINILLRIKIEKLIRDHISDDEPVLRRVQQIYGPKINVLIEHGKLIDVPIVDEIPTDHEIVYYKTDPDSQATLPPFPPGSYALRLANKSMLPFFPPGVLLVANPARSPRDGEFCVLQGRKSNDFGLLQEVPSEPFLVLKHFNSEWADTHFRKRAPKFLHPVTHIIFDGNEKQTT